MTGETKLDKRNSLSTEGKRWESVSLLVFTLVVRLAVLILFAQNLNDDPDAYREIATSLEQSGVFGVAEPRHELVASLEVAEKNEPTFGERQPTATAYRPPLYPLLLVPFVILPIGFPAEVAILHLLLGVSTTWNVYRLGLAWGLGRAALLAAAFVALDPLLLNQSSLVMTETIAAWMTTMILLALENFRTRPRTIALVGIGVIFGLAMLSRPTFVVWFAPLLILHLLLGNWSSSNRQPMFQRLRHVLIVGLVATAVLSPWILRNQFVLYPASQRWQASSRPVLATTHGGYTLLLGNNASFYQSLRSDKQSGVWGVEARGFQEQLDQLETLTLAEFKSKYPELAEEFALAQIDADTYQLDELSRTISPYLEPIRDQQAYAIAKAEMKADASGAVQAIVDRMRQLWTPLSEKRSADESRGRLMLRIAIAIWYSLLYVAIMVAAFRMRWQLLRSPFVWGLVFCCGLTLLHAFFWCNFRMRAPLIPILALLAAAALNSTDKKQKSGEANPS